MSKTKFFFLVTFALFISAIVKAVLPDNFTLKYVYKNPDGSGFRMTRYYLGEGCKYRTEYYSTVQYNISSGAEANVENDTVESRVKADMKAEKIADPVPHTIEILRKDKDLVWTIMPEFKTFFEVPLRPDAWEHSVSGNFISDFNGLKKTGETKIINYDCDVYEGVQKYNEDTWTNIFCAAKKLNVVLKSELLQNGKLVQIMEAAEFSTEPPPSSLFEVPEGYSKSENN